MQIKETIKLQQLHEIDREIILIITKLQNNNSVVKSWKTSENKYKRTHGRQRLCLKDSRKLQPKLKKGGNKKYDDFGSIALMDVV